MCMFPARPSYLPYPQVILSGMLDALPRKSASRQAEGAVNKMRPIFSARVAANIFYYPRIQRNKLKEKYDYMRSSAPRGHGMNRLMVERLPYVAQFISHSRTFQIQASARIRFGVFIYLELVFCIEIFYLSSLKFCTKKRIFY